MWKLDGVLREFKTSVGKMSKNGKKWKHLMPETLCMQMTVVSAGLEGHPHRHIRIFVEVCE